MSLAALYIDASRGPYVDMGLDAWGVERDATRYDGDGPVVTHPPCGPWSQFAHFCGPAKRAQRYIGPIAVDQIRRLGGVMEHPANSKLFKHCNMPRPGEPADAWGGWTIEVEQWLWGHDAIKPTWLYIVGRNDHPPIPEPVGKRPHGSAKEANDGKTGSAFERMPKWKRHLTPPRFAEWLVECASGCVAPEPANLPEMGLFGVLP